MYDLSFNVALYGEGHCGLGNNQPFGSSPKLNGVVPGPRATSGENLMKSSSFCPDSDRKTDGQINKLTLSHNLLGGDKKQTINYKKKMMVSSINT